MAGNPAPKKRSVAVDSDAAKETRRLLDILSMAKTVACAVDELKVKHEETLPKVDVRKLDDLVAALGHIHDEGRRQAAKVSPVKNIERSYHKLQRDAGQEDIDPNSRVSEAMQKVRLFVKESGQTGSGAKKAAVPTAEKSPLPKSKKPRRSSRETAKPVVSPDKSSEKANAPEFSGLPPNGEKRWTRATLISRLSELEGTGKSKQFIRAAVASGLTDYKDHSGVYRMYNKWKKNNKVPGGRGRPETMSLTLAEEAVKLVLRDCTSASSMFTLSDMKAALQTKVKEKAEADGLDPETVKSTVTDETAKHLLIALAMKMGTGLSFTNKAAITKSEPRFVAEHSVMSGLAYATTVLATHFVEGPRPAKMAKFDPKKLGKSAKQTMAWVREAFRAEQIQPVDPNLVLSTDDTTLFVFEGAAEGNGEWEWKLIDKTKGDSSVRSDFAVGSDAENSGGLRVRLTFTFTAAGLAAPPYVAVSGLTAEELSVEKCPDGILATQVPGLCKGGDDLFNQGFGWLVFLRADKKNGGDDEEARLSIANKKFIHYNDDVLLPFIRSIRERLGWTKGQPVPEWMRCCSWFDGDIGQLQTMIFEAREALDDAENITRNKHSAASTGTQQPCDLSPIFKLIKALQKRSTAKDDLACGLRQTIEDLFANHLRANGLNLDGNLRKKRALIDFLLCLPETLEATMKKQHIQKGFVEAGMIDEETKRVPVFDNLVGTSKRWVSCSKDIGIPKEAKQHVMAQVPPLLRLQLEHGQVTYADMHAVCRSSS